MYLWSPNITEAIAQHAKPYTVAIQEIHFWEGESETCEDITYRDGGHGEETDIGVKRESNQ